MSKQPRSTETSVDKTIPAKDLISLLKRNEQQQSKISTLSGEMGEEIKLASDNKYLHRGAYKVLRKIYRMDELKREDFLRQLNLYVDICRVGGVFGPEHTGDLVDLASRRKAAKGGGDDEGEGGEGGEGGGDDEGEGGTSPAGSDAAARVANAAGIKQLVPRKRRGKLAAVAATPGLDGAEAPSGTRVQ